MTTETDIQEQKQPEVPQTIEAALEMITHLKGINTEVIKSRDEVKSKLRTLESSTQERDSALLAEQEKFKLLYQQSEEKLNKAQEIMKNKAVESALKEEILKSGARSVDTVTKLIDKTKLVIGDDYSVDISSIHTQIEELKKTDSILFGLGDDAKFPSVRRPSNGENTTSFEQEMRAAKTHKDIEAVMKKYGKF